MRSFLINKLIRDDVYDSMLELGQQVTVRELDDTAFMEALQHKLFEEVVEFQQAEPSKALDELADTLEVIEAAAEQLGASFDDLRAHQLSRRSQKGGFTRRIFVERLDLQDDDEWVPYYAAFPERFPEVKN